MRLRTMGFAVLYAAAIAVGRLTVLPETGLAVFWPAAGIAVLWLLRTRSRAELGLAATLVAVLAGAGTGLTGATPVVAVVLGLANAVGALATHALVLRAVGPGSTAGGFRQVSDFYRFLAGAGGGVLAGALVAVAGLAVTTGADAWETGLGWWLRHMTAVVVVAGAVVSGRARGVVLARARVVEAALILVVASGVIGWVLGPEQRLPLGFVAVALVVWAGLRLPSLLAVGVGAAVALAALVLSTHGAGGPFGAIADLGDRTLVLQAFMMVTASLAMVLVTVRAQMDDTVHELRAARRTAERAVEDLHIVVEALPVTLFVIDADGRIVLSNEAATRWAADAPRSADGELRIRDVLAAPALAGVALPEEDRPSTRALRGERVTGLRIAGTDEHGRPRVIAVDAVPLHHDPDAAPDRAVLLWQDVTEDHEDAERLRRARERSERLIADAPHGILVLDPTGRIVRANRALATMFGLDGEELVGAPVWALAPDTRQEVEDYLRRAVEFQGRLLEAEWTVPGPGGSPMHVSTTSRFVTDALDGDEIIVNVVDVSERRRYEERLAHLADHDALTGLPNRRKFEEAMTRHQALCERYGPRGALLLIDLDHFKEVNDTLGHAAGDHLITATGHIIRAGIRSADLVARLGGDEFAVLLPEADEAGAETVARHLVESIREHCSTLEGATRRVTASIGVVAFAAAAHQGSDVMALADMLMYDAKDAGRDGFVLLTNADHRHPRLGARLEWQARIEHALEHDEFEVHLQPILDVALDRVTRAEALVRLRDGSGLIEPARFVYIAEATGLAPALDAWVLRRSVEILAELQCHTPGFTLEVNLSGHSIGHPDVERALVEALTVHGVDASTLVLEVTETAAVRDVAAAKGFGERLRALGTHFALDDFGAGYGSFYYLKHLVFDYVKIDGEFVTDAHRSDADRRMLRAIVDVARHLGKGTVAEFVADEECFATVTELGIDYAQGYFIGRPTSPERFLAAYLDSDRPVVGAAPRTGA